MGGVFSEEGSALGDFPTTGHAVMVKVQCSHNGKCLMFGEFRGHLVTSDWTTAHLQEAIELLAGVHRQCQRLMFGGRVMEPKAKISSMLACGEQHMPGRIKLFLIVDRHKFPQTLGPFNLVDVPLEGARFEMPELCEDLRRQGFYWEMNPKVLETHGLQARTKRLFAQVSPAHPVELQPKQRAVPKGACDFVWSYPAAGWEGVESDCYAMDRWEEGLESGAAVKSFLSVGGFMYFNDRGTVSGIRTLGRPDEGDTGCIHFAEPKRWLPEWTPPLAEMGRFQKNTLKAMRETGVRMYLWLRPHEVIEAVDGTPMPVQPEAPYGAFVYLFHDNVLATDEVETALDRYFAVAPPPRSENASGNPGFFRALTLIDGDRYMSSIGGPPGDCDTFCQDDSSDDEGTVASFMMSTPAASMGSPSSMASPFASRSPHWSAGVDRSSISSPPSLPFHDRRHRHG
mmetsp:Transcript_78379/g.227473  ORF Transcript_78379/g.227473 Transcript_78379/m.227473 type:complete len:455 (-) Transcript_78379:115-1479(-)